MNLIPRRAKITFKQTRPHPEGGTEEYYEGVIPGGTFEVKERHGWFQARANGDDSTIQIGMDEGGLVAWFKKILG